MNTLKYAAVLLSVLTIFSIAQAGSTKTSTIVKDGNKITTKVKTNKHGTTTTVTTKDKEGKVTTTTTVTDKEGNIISTDDPQAQAKADKAARKKKEKQTALANAPKRDQNDPVDFVLFQTVVGENLRKVTNKEGVFPHLRKEFENDKVIKLLNQRKVDSYAKKYDFKTGEAKSLSSFGRGPSFLPADIYVETFGQLKEKYGISKTTKKAASAPYLFYRAVIYSEFSDKTWEVKESGHILKNPEVTKKFAKKIRATILGKAGGTIPANSEKFRRGNEGMTENQIDAKEAFRNLFKKK